MACRNAEILLIGSLGTNLNNEMWIDIYKFQFKEVVYNTTRIRTNLTIKHTIMHSPTYRGIEKKSTLINTLRSRQNVRYFGGDISSAFPWTKTFDFVNKQGTSEGFDSCDRPSNLTQIGSKWSIFCPCDLKIWWMTPTNNKAACLLYYIKLCVSFQIH